MTATLGRPASGPLAADDRWLSNQTVKLPR